MPERYSSRISCIRCCTRCSISLRPEPMVSFRDTVDDRSHGGFRHFPDSLLRIDELKLVQCRIPDIPAHGIGEIDDILVAGEHQLLARACRNIYGADLDRKST